MAGYSGTPLQQKLGLKEQMNCCVLNSPEHYFDLVSPLPDEMHFNEKCNGMLDFIHLFSKDRKKFESDFLNAKKHLKDTGMLWVSWPKKAAKVQTDLDENIIRDFGLKSGLVDVKVCAVDETWSGLKFVWRLKDRVKP
jgi:hypothetical protein